MRSKSAFSLIELMIVVVIIGILAMIAMPSYKTYVINSRFSEAYANIDAINKNELSYFQEHREFFGLALNPATITNPMIIGPDATWDTYGYAISQNSNVYFAYRAWAGKTDASGSDLAFSLVTGDPFTNTLFDNIPAATTPAGNCNRSAGAISTYGVNIGVYHDWLATVAVADFDGDNTDEKCSAVIKVTESSPNTNNSPKSSGFIVLNKGK